MRLAKMRCLSSSNIIFQTVTTKKKLQMLCQFLIFLIFIFDKRFKETFCSSAGTNMRHGIPLSNLPWTTTSFSHACWQDSSSSRLQSVLFVFVHSLAEVNVKSNCSFEIVIFIWLVWFLSLYNQLPNSLSATMCYSWSARVPRVQSILPIFQKQNHCNTHNPT